MKLFPFIPYALIAPIHITTFIYKYFCAGIKLIAWIESFLLITNTSLPIKSSGKQVKWSNLNISLIVW